MPYGYRNMMIVRNIFADLPQGRTLDGIALSKIRASTSQFGHALVARKRTKDVLFVSRININTLLPSGA